MPKEQFLALETKVRNFTLLYVEDNKGLQEQASRVFKKIFKNMITANSGEEALELFKEYEVDIVITDINMGKLNGLELSREIKKIDPFVKIIITSAFDDKEYLFEAIDVNVSKYLKKPITISELTNAITKVVDEIEFEKNKNLFEHYIKDVFHHQDSMLILLKGESVLIVNKKCLEFFSQKSVDGFRELFLDFDKLILKHNNFLYNHDDIDWMQSAKRNNGKLFNVKIADKNATSRHFVLKAYKIPDKEETYILSFDDITDLNLLVMYDKDAMKREEQKSQQKIIYGVLEIIKRNNSDIKMYNSYKGLNISNVGTIGDITLEKSLIQVPYTQLRAIKINNSVTIESELLPSAVLCDIEKVDFENSQVILKNYKLIESMPSQQEFIRVEPELNHKVSLFYEGRKIHVEARILDVSIGGAKLVMSLLPAGFKEEDELVLDMVFTAGAKPLIVNTKAKVKNLRELKREFVVILRFEDDSKVTKLLTGYVASRQMALIREFKKLAQDL